MPELPDVETFRRYMTSKALNKRISSLSVEEGRVLAVSRQKLSARLVGEMLTGTHRHGKHLFAAVGNDGGHLVLHFGMTGFLEYYEEEEDAPRHARLTLAFTNGYHLAFDCQRKLGQVGFTDRIEDYITQKKLGPDALGVERDEFIERLAARSGKIKPTLMNQRVIAGIGNVYADEILFKARIHPEKGASALDEADLGRLYSKTQQVLKKAIEVGANPDKLPRSYLIPRRAEGEKCPGCGGEVKAITISGRRGYYCPRCQKK